MQLLFGFPFAIRIPRQCKICLLEDQLSLKYHSQSNFKNKGIGHIKTERKSACD